MSSRRSDIAVLGGARDRPAALSRDDRRRAARRGLREPGRAV